MSINVLSSAKSNPEKISHIQEKFKNVKRSNSEIKFNNLEKENIKNQCFDEETNALEFNSKEMHLVHPSCDLSRHSKLKSICVAKKQKSNMAHNLLNPDIQSVIVAHAAPSNAPLKTKVVSSVDLGGARLDSSGKIIAHSILGKIDNFLYHATTRGDLPQNILEKYENSPDVVDSNLKSQLSRPKCSFTRKRAINAEEHSLKNWDDRMRERRKQQNYLAGLLDRPVNMLAMNQGDNCRKNNEYKQLIDRTLPIVDVKSQKAIGNEFWNLPAIIGDEETGLRSTLKNSEKGVYKPIIHIGIPKTIQQLQGLEPDNIKDSIKKPWHRSDYLRDKCDKLSNLMYSVMPHEPDIANLEVVGNDLNYENEITDQLDCLPKTMIDIEQPVSSPTFQIEEPQPAPQLYGPSIIIAGQEARWTPENMAGGPGLEARVAFDTHLCQKQVSYLDITNNGSTAIYYNWTKVHQQDSFNLNTNTKPIFYLNPNQGVILPGRRLLEPFIFKSEKEGVFQEQWKLNTHPRLIGGASIIVTLKGVAVQGDLNQQERQNIECGLDHKEATQVVGDILNCLLQTIETSERSASPLYLHLTERQRFLSLNPTFEYSRENCNALNLIYLDSLSELGNTQLSDWNLEISTIKNIIMLIPEKNDKKQLLLDNLNNTLAKMSIVTKNPCESFTYGFGYKKMCDIVSCIAFKWEETKNNMLPLQEPKFEPIKSASNISVSSKKSIKSSHSKSKAVAEEALTEDTKSEKGSQLSTFGSSPTKCTLKEDDLREKVQMQFQRIKRFRELQFKEKFYMQAFDVVTKGTNEAANLFSEM